MTIPSIEIEGRRREENNTSMIPSSRKRAVFVETNNTFSFGKNKATDALHLREVSEIASDFQIDDGLQDWRIK